ncbi:pyridoxamine 5'-phosphate oxidase family protein [Microvirga sp. W0021]|uniref:Pyridoxamine 5'-phosphate oxidase family protein n=1 Tax=Hohaiivirga grylli TaxID=3133970 RepID=A0ABV0BJK8_9HYPH
MSISSITPRDKEIPQSAREAFDARELACTIIRTYRSAALATLDPSGYPYSSVTDVVSDQDGSLVFLMAGVALHTRNIKADNRISVILANLGQGDALSKERLTLVGRCELVDEQDIERLSFRFLQRHPKEKAYLGLPDARLYRLNVESVQLSAGPGRNASDVTAEELKTDISGAEQLLTDEPKILADINASPERLSALAKSQGLSEGRWKVTGIDPEGIDLTLVDQTIRIWFKARVTNQEALMIALDEAVLEI